MSHFNQNNLLYNSSMASAPNYNVKHVVEFTSDVLKTLQDRKQCDAIIMDFSKAFDKVSHGNLINKLQRIGIDKQAVRWITSFLTD